MSYFPAGGVMFEIIVVLSALGCVGMLVYVHATFSRFPPKARLLSDIWAMVENGAKKND